MAKKEKIYLEINKKLNNFGQNYGFYDIIECKNLLIERGKLMRILVVGDIVGSPGRETLKLF